MEERTDNARRIALRLELDPGAEPISGRLTGTDGVGVDFIGWLALSAALERLGPASRPASKDP
jgi:hypothetical protein